MEAEIPLVRLFAACEELEYNVDGGKEVTLRRVFHRIARLPGEPFPCVREQMSLYALLTNGRGKHQFGIALFFLENGVERKIAGPFYREIDLGNDPTIVHGLPVPQIRAIFHEPGQYSFVLLCDEQRIAEYHIEVQ